MSYGTNVWGVLIFPGFSIVGKLLNTPNNFLIVNISEKRTQDQIIRANLRDQDDAGSFKAVTNEGEYKQKLGRRVVTNVVIDLSFSSKTGSKHYVKAKCPGTNLQNRRY